MEGKVKHITLASCLFLALLFWMTWIERNMKVLYGVEIPIERIRDKLLKTLYVWKEEELCSSSFDVVDSVDSLFLGCN